MKAPLSARLQPVTVIILCTLLEIGTVALGGLGGSVRCGRDALRDTRRFTGPRIRKALRQLRLQRLVTFDPKDRESPIILTTRGLIRAKQETTRWAFARRTRMTRWDHLWRLVVFDIPARRKIRHAFRHELKTLGFYPIQYSVYAHPHECEETIKELAAPHGLSRNIMTFTVPTLGTKEAAARRFFLAKK